MLKRFCFTFMAFLVLSFLNQLYAQEQQWTTDGNGYYQVDEKGILKYTLPQNTSSVFIAKEKLVPAGSNKPLPLYSFKLTPDESKLLIFTNTQKVWRYNTRGDYWVYETASGSLKQIGKTLPSASLMFAKISPDNSKVAYVSNYNLYVEDLQTGQITALTTGGDRKHINGTFDWAYEEEFFCRDGFRWSPDSKKIAYWQIIMGDTKVYNMVNNTDSIYPKLIPIEYPVAGEKPSEYKIGVVGVEDKKTTWMTIPDDATWGTYLPRMEWAANSNELIIQHLNRLQNESNLMLCNVNSGDSKTIYTDKDEAWVDIFPFWDEDYSYGGWDWLKGGKEFLWASEKDGWRHLYKISRDGKKETLITKGNFDIMDIAAVDEKGGYVYYHASPDNATQKYLFRSRIDGKGKAEKITPANQEGTNNYLISPYAKYAIHSFSNYYTRPAMEWVNLPSHKAFNGKEVVNEALLKADKSKSNVSFFTVTTEDGVKMDGWMANPLNFDPNKKYPVVFYVYTEPASQTVMDVSGAGRNFLYKGDMANDGYIYISLDGRGTPAAKGRAWRKSIYKKIGEVNIRDQAMAAKEILKWPFTDSSRVAVWGWSGGGTATLNLLFQYPEIYKTGISIAAVVNELTYDNIYQERYSGLPQLDPLSFKKRSPIFHAKNMRGNLLYIHGTGDDNVHYNNAEMLINELVKYNKQFQLMSYPNRSHSISEGEGTFPHLQTLYTNYLQKNCPPGGR